MKLILSLVAALSLVCAPVAIIGCKTPQQTTYKATAVTVRSVNLAMEGWMDYVMAEEKRIAALPKPEQIPAKQALLAREGRVMNAYGEYQNTIKSFRAAMVTTANSDTLTHPELVAVANTLLSVIKSNKN